jgi:large subunit ribosomal protein L23
MSFFDKWKKNKKSSLPAPKENSVVVPHSHENTEAPREKRAVSISSRAHAVLLSPYVSEKAAVAESFGTYTFIVARSATKPAIYQAIKDVYGVSPASVRMIHLEGKQIRSGRNTAQRSNWKKAMITLPKGQSIRIHEGV